MASTKLILRSVNSNFPSPFQDVTLGSVLSHVDLDNNQIYLKSEIIYTAETSGTVVTFNKIGGNNFDLDLGPLINSTDNYTTGATLIDNVIYYDRSDALSAYTVDLSAFTTVELWTAGTGTNAVVQAGSDGVASGSYSLSSGYQTEAAGSYSHAAGYQTASSGISSYVVGHQNIATTGGRASFVGGGYRNDGKGGTNYPNTVSGESSFIYGWSNEVGGQGAFALGSQNVVTPSSIGGAMGSNNYVTGGFAIGNNNTIYNGGSVALGQSNIIEASSAIAMNRWTKVTAQYGFAGGNGSSNWPTIAQGQGSFAFYGTSSIGANDEISGATGSWSAILGGSNHEIVGDGDVNRSAIIGGNFNKISGDSTNQAVNSFMGGGDTNILLGASRSAIIGGTGITGTSNDTAYVPNLNIGIIGSGTSVINLGYDANGFVVTGTTGGDSLWTAGTGTNAAVLSGSNSTASGNNSVAEGNTSIASGTTSHASGTYTLASAEYSFAGGYNQAHTIVGDGFYGGLTGITVNGNIYHVNANGEGSFVYGGADSEGPLQVDGAYSQAFGYNNVNLSNYSAVFGRSNFIQGGQYSFVSGRGNAVSGTTNFVSGQDNTLDSSSEENIVGGNGNRLVGASNSIIVGQHGGAGSSATIGGGSLIVAGNNNSVGGSYSTINGSNNILTSATYSSIFGSGNEVQEDASYSYVFGDSNISTGEDGAVIMGLGCTVSGLEFSTAIGVNHVVTGDRTVVLGGSGITGSSSDTVYVPHLEVQGQSNNPIHVNGSGSTFTLDFNNSNIQTVTLTGNTTMNNPSNIKDGATYTVIVKQDDSGPHLINSWGSNFKFENGTTPTLGSSGSTAVDILTFISDGTNLYGLIAKNFY